MMSMELTELEKEAAWQLVHLSESETTATTPTASSGSCTSTFSTRGVHREEKTNTNMVIKKKRSHENDINGKDDRNKNKCNNNEISSSSLMILPTKEEDKDEDYDEKGDLKRKVRRYRSIVEVYKVTKPLFSL